MFLDQVLQKIDCREQQKNNDIEKNNHRAGLEPDANGSEKSCKETENTRCNRADDHTLETFAQAHCGKGRENDQSRNHNGSHHFHADNHRHGGQHRNQRSVNGYIDTRGACKGFVECDCKNAVVENHKQNEHRNRNENAEQKVCVADGENACRAEQGGADLLIALIGEVIQQTAERNRARGQYRDGGVTVDLAVFTRAQQEECRNHNNGHCDVIGRARSAEHRCNGKCAEACVGKAVTDHGEALEHKRYTEQ